MTARILVLICGLAALALGAAGSATAQDRPWTANQDDLETRYDLAVTGLRFAGTRHATATVPHDLSAGGLNGGLTLAPDRARPLHGGVNLAGDGAIDGLWPEIWGPVVPYAGFGLGKINLAVQFETGELELEKEYDFMRARLIAGVGYEVTERVSFGLEYLAVADNDPLFALNVSGEDVELNTRFTNHYLSLRAQIKF